MSNPLFPLEPYEGDHYRVIGDGPYEIEGPAARLGLWFDLRAANRKAKRLEQQFTEDDDE